MKFLKKLFTKKIEVPESNEVKEIEAVQLWYVRWWARHGEFAHNLKQVTEAFTSEEEAEEFAKSLRNAFKLLRHTSGDRVIVEKN